MIGELRSYVMKHTERGTCRCGQCIDHPGHDSQPTGHTADLVFFDVAAKDAPDAGELRQLVSASREGDFANVDCLDGQEHSYIELGAWIGDQGMALMLMGLGKILGLWELLTPRMLPGLPDSLVNQMAGAGMITIKALAPPRPEASERGEG